MMEVRFNRNRESGNIFYIMGRAIASLKQECREADAKMLFLQVTHSKSYDEALEIIAEYVELEEETDGYDY